MLPSWLILALVTNSHWLLWRCLRMMMMVEDGWWVGWGDRHPPFARSNSSPLNPRHPPILAQPLPLLLLLLLLLLQKERFSQRPPSLNKWLPFRLHIHHKCKFWQTSTHLHFNLAQEGGRVGQTSAIYLIRLSPSKASRSLAFQLLHFSSRTIFDRNPNFSAFQHTFQLSTFERNALMEPAGRIREVDAANDVTRALPASTRVAWQI